MSGSILALDIGLKRTGAAIGHSQSGSARPAGQISVNQGRHDWPKLDKLISEWQPEMILIGNPGSTDPHLTKAINRVKSHIQQNHKIPIRDIDETLTSSAANVELQDYSMSLKKKTLIRDQIAACLILETYLNEQST